MWSALRVMMEKLLNLNERSNNTTVLSATGQFFIVLITVIQNCFNFATTKSSFQADG